MTIMWFRVVIRHYDNCFLVDVKDSVREPILERIDFLLKRRVFLVSNTSTEIPRIVSKSMSTKNRLAHHLNCTAASTNALWLNVCSYACLKWL